MSCSSRIVTLRSFLLPLLVSLLLSSSVQTLSSCEEVTGESGVYSITVNSANYDVYCDMETDGGGWTVFYKRIDGSANFDYDVTTFNSEGVGSPSDAQFLLPLGLLHLMTGMSSTEHQLLVEMNEAPSSRSFALYQSFSIAATLPQFQADRYYTPSTAGNSLALAVAGASDQDVLPLSCADLFYSPYQAGINCHAASPFGKYEDNSYGKGITWSSWLGFYVSIDQIQFKFRKHHCATVNTSGICTLCDSGYSLIVSTTSGRSYCSATATSPAPCSTPLIYSLESNSCIDPEACDINNSFFPLGEVCIKCHSSCSQCSGPLASDCIYTSCLEASNSQTSLLNKEFTVQLYLNSQLFYVSCAKSGWTTALENSSFQSVAHLDYSSYQNTGLSELKSSFFLPLMALQSLITSGGDFQIHFEIVLSDDSVVTDSYGSFSLQEPGYTWHSNYKHNYSTSLAQFDLSALLNGQTFQAQGAQDQATNHICALTLNAGSWYGSGCSGFVLLGNSLFYGPQNSLKSVKMLVRQSQCSQWEVGTSSGSASCVSCKSPFKLDATSQSCIACEQGQVCAQTLDNGRDSSAQPNYIEDPSLFTKDTVLLMGRVTQTATQAIVPSSLTVSSFSSFSLNNLWTFLNNLQLVTFLQFVNVPSLPWNFSLFLSYLDVSLGDVPFIKSVPNMLRLVVPMNFTLHEERAQAHFTNPYLHVSSYESRSFILNYEMRIVALFYYSFFLTLIILLARFCKDNKKCASFLRQFYSEFFFWRLFLELYVEMSFLSFYSLEDLNFQNAPQILNATLALLTATAVTLTPIILTICLLKHRNVARQSKTEWRGKIATHDLNLSKKLTARILSNPLFLYERLIFAVVLVFLTSAPQIQLCILIPLFFLVSLEFQNQMMLYVVLSRPYDSCLLQMMMVINYVTLFSECSLMLLLYFKDAEGQSFYDKIGTAMIWLLVGNIVFNFVATLIPFIAALFSILCCKKKKDAQSKYIHPVSKSEIADPEPGSMLSSVDLSSGQLPVKEEVPKSRRLNFFQMKKSRLNFA